MSFLDNLFAPDYTNLLQRHCHSSIRIHIGGEASLDLGVSHFGGKPDVPEGFQWPIYQNMPLTFLAQLSCKELAPLDINHELPETGLLSFFYALDNECFGYDARDIDGFRAFWFDENEPLHTQEFVIGVSKKNMLPRLGIRYEREATYPHCEDFTILNNGQIEDYNKFEEAEKELGIHRTDAMHRTLGWADLIQNNTTWRCELLSQGYSFGPEFMKIPEEIREGSKLPSVHRWKLLFQLGTVKEGDYTLMFGDAGKIYFYIPEEDLKARRFDRVCGEMQCY